MSRLTFALPLVLLACSSSPASFSNDSGAQPAADVAPAVDAPVTPTDAGLAVDVAPDVSSPDAGCDPVVAAPAVDTTSCAAPAANDGGVVPYYQCTSATVCPPARFHNSVTQPNFRLTYLNVTAPTALASAAILNTINPTLQTGAFLWGLQLDLTANTFRTGGLNPTITRGVTGVGLMDGRFTFFHDNGPTAGAPSRYNPISGTLTVTGSRVATAVVTTTLNIPVFNDVGSTTLVTELPLDNAVITNLALTADRGCIGGGIPTGGRYTETTSRWLTEDACDVPYATLDADITVANARAVNVYVGGSPIVLCNIISGATCATDPQSTWPHRPDATVNGAPAFHLRANFAGVSADIAR